MEILRIFKPSLVTFIFPTCKNIEEIVFEANLQQLLSQTLLKTANTSDIYSQIVTFYYT